MFGRPRERAHAGGSHEGSEHPGEALLRALPRARPQGEDRPEGGGGPELPEVARLPVGPGAVAREPREETLKNQNPHAGKSPEAEALPFFARYVERALKVKTSA